MQTLLAPSRKGEPFGRGNEEEDGEGGEEGGGGGEGEGRRGLTERDASAEQETVGDSLGPTLVSPIFLNSAGLSGWHGAGGRIGRTGGEGEGGLGKREEEEDTHRRQEVVALLEAAGKSLRQAEEGSELRHQTKGTPAVGPKISEEQEEGGSE